MTRIFCLSIFLSLAPYFPIASMENIESKKARSVPIDALLIKLALTSQEPFDIEILRTESFNSQVRISYENEPTSLAQALELLSNNKIRTTVIQANSRKTLIVGDDVKINPLLAEFSSDREMTTNLNLAPFQVNDYFKSADVLCNNFFEKDENMKLTIKTGNTLRDFLSQVCTEKKVFYVCDIFPYDTIPVHVEKRDMKEVNAALVDAALKRKKNKALIHFFQRRTTESH